jgi:DNA-binding NtrC family response regulator
MGAIPSELMESELFGYEKGAFTGANSRKTGKFEEAHTGTLFLDEVAELDLNLQTKLLRVLQERELQRIGGHETIKFDVRLIVATNKNLSDEVKKGNFREDLYYRIMGMPITMPPLRKRGDDIIILARHFLDQFCIENHLAKKQISQEAADKLLAHPFPGNIRELKSAIELAAVMTSDEEIKASDISFNAVPKNDLFFEGDHTLRHFTTQIIESYLKRFNYNVVKTAHKLDMGKSTIYKMIQDGEISIPD